MAKNERGYKIPDAYTACSVLIGFDKEAKQLKLVMSKRGALDKSGNADPFDGKWAIPESYVEYGMMANETAKEIVEYDIGLTADSMFLRHIGVFDSPTRDTRGWYIVNIFYAVVNYEQFTHILNNENYEIVSEKKISSLAEQVAYDHFSIINKVIKNIKNDIYTQIFNKTLFESDVISELLGNKFSARDLQDLGEYVGLSYDRTTYYRNINKFYTKSGSIKIAGIKKPVTLYTKERNE